MYGCIDIDVSMHRCIDVYRCIEVLMRRWVGNDVSMSRLIVVSMYRCIDIDVAKHRCIIVSMYWYRCIDIDILMSWSWYVGIYLATLLIIMVCWCVVVDVLVSSWVDVWWCGGIDVLMCWYVGELMSWCVVVCYDCRLLHARAFRRVGGYQIWIDRGHWLQIVDVQLCSVWIQQQQRQQQ